MKYECCLKKDGYEVDTHIFSTTDPGDGTSCGCGVLTRPLSKAPESGVGLKYDKEKIRMELLSPTWLEGVAKVLTYGSRKYSAENWRQGIELQRLIAGMMRHLNAFRKGEDNDPETGLSHLLHLSCGAMFASEIHRTKPELDDRVKE